MSYKNKNLEIIRESNRIDDLNAVKNGNPVACALFLGLVVMFGCVMIAFVIMCILMIITWFSSNGKNDVRFQLKNDAIGRLVTQEISNGFKNIADKENLEIKGINRQMSREKKIW